jgi:charged multivesicular body protein 4A/B
MMASFMSYFTGRRDPKQTARDAIVSLREQLMMIEKKEEHLQRQIAQDLATAKANAVSNKNGMPSFPLRTNAFLQLALFFWDWASSYNIAATAALRRKKMHEGDLEKLSGMRLQLEVQVNTLESANINANTLDVMRRGASALKDIHNGLYAPFPPSPSLSSIYTDPRRKISSLTFCLCVLLLVLSPQPLVWFLVLCAGFPVTWIRSMRR